MSTACASFPHAIKACRKCSSPTTDDSHAFAATLLRTARTIAAIDASASEPATFSPASAAASPSPSVSKLARMATLAAVVASLFDAAAISRVSRTRAVTRSGSALGALLGPIPSTLSSDSNADSSSGVFQAACIASRNSRLRCSRRCRSFVMDACALRCSSLSRACAADRTPRSAVKATLFDRRRCLALMSAARNDLSPRMPTTHRHARVAHPRTVSSGSLARSNCDRAHASECVL